MGFAVVPQNIALAFPCDNARAIVASRARNVGPGVSAVKLGSLYRSGFVARGTGDFVLGKIHYMKCSC